MMTRYELIVPTEPNPGSEVSRATFSATLEMVRADLGWRFNGYRETVAVGGWRATREPIVIFTVDSDDYGARTFLRELAEELRETLAQEAMYLTAAPIESELI